MVRSKNKIKGDIAVNIVINILLVLLAVIMLYPLWFVIIASISDPAEIALGNVFILPRKISFDAYLKISDYPEIIIGYRNSLFYLLAGPAVALLFTLPAAYSLSRKKLMGRRGLNLYFIITMYFAGGMIPTYMLHSAIGWLDTIWVMLVPNAVQAYYLILARSSFSSIPEALHESASIDGASEFRFFVQFAIPLSKAMIAVVFLFSALSWWNEYMRFLIYIDSPELQSLQVFVRQITQALTSSLSNMGASSGEILEAIRTKELLKYSMVVITALPFCLLYPFIQKYFNQGVMLGAVKE